MALFTSDQRRQCTAIARLGYANPFRPERIEVEREILGEAFVPGHSVWSLPQALDASNPNLQRIDALTAELAGGAAQRLAEGATFFKGDLDLYADAALYSLFN